MSVSSFLNKPFPARNDLKRALRQYLLVGLFIASFLMVFQPFGINNWETSNKYLKLIGYGIIAFVVPSLVTLILLLMSSAWKLDERWTTRAEILSVMSVLILIGLCNLFYCDLLGIISISFKSCLWVMGVTLLVGIFPVTFHVSYKYNLFRRESENLSERLNHDFFEKEEQQSQDPGIAVISLIAENGKDTISISDHQLYFIESSDNYVTVHFHEDGVPKKQLLRSSLRRIESQIDHSNIVRCHRTYIVNLNQVTQMEGNAAGCKLNLKNGLSVPVSRTYMQAVAAHLRS